jgi:hypothetical protein
MSCQPLESAGERKRWRAFLSAPRMKSQRLNPSQVARAAKSLRMVLAFIEHTPEHVRAEKADSIQRAYKFLDAPADNQQRGRELVAALNWSLDFIMKHSEGRAGSELADAFALLRELRVMKPPTLIRGVSTVLRSVTRRRRALVR